MAKDEDVSVGVSTRGGAHVPHAKYEKLIARAKEVPPVTTIVAHPCDETSLRGATEAAEAGIIVPILVGPVAKIASVAKTSRARYQPLRHCRRASQSRRSGEGGAAHPRRQRRALDEGQPAYR